MGDIEWGTAGEWFGGVGGFLAVLVALWIARRERQGRIEERDRRIRVEGEERTRLEQEAVQARRRRAALVEVTRLGGWGQPSALHVRLGDPEQLARSGV